MQETSRGWHHSLLFWRKHNHPTSGPVNLVEEEPLLDGLDDVTLPENEEDPSEIIEEVQKNTHADGYGVKSISFFGGLCLLINNITGPGEYFLSITFRSMNGRES